MIVDITDKKNCDFENSTKKQSKHYRNSSLRNRLFYGVDAYRDIAKTKPKFNGNQVTYLIQDKFVLNRTKVE